MQTDLELSSRSAGLTTDRGYIHSYDVAIESLLSQAREYENRRLFGAAVCMSSVAAELETILERHGGMKPAGGINA